MKNLPEFPVKLEIPVSWGEMDAFGHVNNTIYFKYFENIRIEYFQKIGYLELMKKSGFGPILASTSCKFRAPLQYPDFVIVGTKVTKIDKDRFWMIYQVFSKKLENLAAEGEGVIVSYDYNKKEKVNIPELIIERIKELEKEI